MGVGGRFGRRRGFGRVEPRVVPARGPARPEPDPEPADFQADPPALSDPVLAALRELVERASEPTQVELVSWWREWQLGPELGELLVEHLCELGHAGRVLALPLHEQLHPILQAKLEGNGEDKGEDAALLDFVLVEHLLALGLAERALELLRVRRSRLPSEQLQDLLPPSPTRGGQRIRIELYELVVTAHEQLGDDRQVDSLLELARLQPLAVDRLDRSIARLSALTAEHPDPAAGTAAEHLALLRRAAEVRSILDDAGFTPNAALAAAPVEAPSKTDTAAETDIAETDTAESQPRALVRHKARSLATGSPRGP